MTNDRHRASPNPSKDVGLLLSYKVDRRLTVEELFQALEVGKTTYYEWREKGQPVPPLNLIRAAENLDLNPFDILIEYGWLTREQLFDYLGADPTGPQGANGAATTKVARGRRMRASDADLLGSARHRTGRRPNPNAPAL